MRDRHFMEDENELPYLVWESRDNNEKNRNSEPIRLNLEYKDIPFSEFSSYVKRLALAPNHMNNIISSIEVEPKNCTFSIHQKGNTVYLSLTLKNEYVTSIFYGSYDTDDSEISFNFPSTFYKGLESMQWFKNEIRRVENEIGLKFDTETGGYHFEWADEKLQITEEFNIFVHFRDEDPHSGSHGYEVDFKNKKLEKYHVFSWLDTYIP